MSQPEHQDQDVFTFHIHACRNAGTVARFNQAQTEARFAYPVRCPSLPQLPFSDPFTIEGIDLRNVGFDKNSLLDCTIINGIFEDEAQCKAAKKAGATLVNPVLKRLTPLETEFYAVGDTYEQHPSERGEPEKPRGLNAVGPAISDWREHLKKGARPTRDGEAGDKSAGAQR